MTKRRAAGRRDPRLPPIIQVYIAGATIGNPGPGAYAIAWMEWGKRRKIVKGARNTTSPRMQLKALKYALEYFPPGADIIILSSSEYVIKGMTSWRLKWARNNWKRGNGDPVAYRDLWEAIIELHKARTGSTGYRSPSLDVHDPDNPMFDRINRLANAAARAMARRTL